VVQLLGQMIDKIDASYVTGISDGRYMLVMRAISHVCKEKSVPLSETSRDHIGRH